ncbi:peptidase M14 carboxypeptidase A [Gemmatirosa kalamazoonensis]|uniref:Peptidase M14 carboxypeptidase A n=1 Tax=Gemmatirosa kalamazoonensis TaxID=861299 RepID=W0RIL7_9BACT|nr:M14 metallopeptidase family protein [Gemmatirosa kalamazoonensis]AHG89233.1 peptidase M14 carboxypeptidase A [Gemmatirosa kalamazoonensis]
MNLRLLAALAALPTALAAQIPTPASVIGWDPGTDRKLPEWKQVVAYFQALDAASPRITVKTLGKTTLGRPFLAAFIGDSATIANLPRYQELQRTLSDPRFHSADEIRRAAADDKVVVLVTSGIHSTEVGGNLTPMKLAERLVGGEDEEARAIRRNALTILVPSLNPDGVDIVGDWYRSSLGTAWEGTQPPQLYHYYTGHDDNRDWYAFTQAETRMVIDSLYNQWHPQIVNDIHQQGANGTRIFIPPYMDPIEPNIDPILMAGVAQMGKAMTWRLTAQGFVGVANNTSYDAWTPARAYQHYHGAIRILTETASAALASPIDVPFESLRPGYNVDPKETGVDFLTKWPGGHWTVGDIVRYQTAASMALLAEAAGDRDEWLASYVQVQKNAVAGNTAAGRTDWPATIVIPAQPVRDTAVNAAVRILQRGQVEVRRAPAAFSAGGRSFPAGSLVIYTAQPYGAFAKTLLEPQHYPNLREYPGGPPKRPYDVTAHTLPLLMGFDVAFVKDSVTAPTALLTTQNATPWVARGLTDNKARRIAVFANYSPSMDEGWTRWLLDQYRIPFTVVHAKDLRGGSLNAKFDAIILPEQNARQIANGPMNQYPDSLKGGVGKEGAAALKSFVDAGGTLVAFNDASDYAIEALELPVKNVLDGLRSTDFYAPGSIFRVELDSAHPLAAGMTAPQPMAWFESGPAFEVTDPSRATVVARYPAQGDPLLSGWLLGGSKLNGKAALVDVRQGKGHVVLFGFRPQYRGQTMATFPLLWNALKPIGGSGIPVTKAATR